MEPVADSWESKVVVVAVLAVVDTRKSKHSVDHDYSRLHYHSRLQ